MAMPKKAWKQRGWRPITVDGTIYRWSFRRSLTERRPRGEGNVYLRVVKGYVYRGFVAMTSVRWSFFPLWLDYGYSEIITPSLVAKYIRLALEQGWHSGHPDPWFVVRTEAGEGEIASQSPPETAIQ